ncbi:MAG: hypothetical protein JSU63_01300, partial [Phycisphaerales bacterium]
VLSRKSTGVRALFIPKIMTADGKSVFVEELVARYIPKVKSYGFDETDVLGELRYYGAKEKDLPFVLEALSYIGIVPYVTADGEMRLFKIDIHNGRFAAKTTQ